jgi:hypothetical protein
MSLETNKPAQGGINKVPEVTLVFWAIKIVATTLGETGGDAVSMSLGLGYLAATGIFAAIFGVAVVAQIAAKRFRPALYWTTIIATTTVGTTLADFADRSLGIGYAGGSALLLGLLHPAQEQDHRRPYPASAHGCGRGVRALTRSQSLAVMQRILRDLGGGAHSIPRRCFAHCHN